MYYLIFIFFLEYCVTCKAYRNVKDIKIPQANKENSFSRAAIITGRKLDRKAEKRKIKGSLSSSWMNSPIPSLLLPLWQNESLFKLLV